MQETFFFLLNLAFLKKKCNSNVILHSCTNKQLYLSRFSEFPSDDGDGHSNGVDAPKRGGGGRGGKKTAPHCLIYIYSL